MAMNIASLPERRPALRWRESVFRLVCVTWEPVASMLREPSKWRTHKDLSTDARHRGGSTCSSNEVPVMGIERRG